MILKFKATSDLLKIGFTKLRRECHMEVHVEQVVKVLGGVASKGKAKILISSFY